MGFSITAYAKKDPISSEGDTTTGKIDFDIDPPKTSYPLHISFCIDKSSSMGKEINDVGSGTSRSRSDSEKITIAKNGLTNAIDQLTQQDYFGVVAFDREVEEVVSPLKGHRSNRARSHISDLDSGGGTDIENGLNRSKKQLQQMPSEAALEWIVLISDGRGNLPSKEALRSDFASDGISVYSAGVGDGYDKSAIKESAQLTQAEWRHISSGSELLDFFKDIVSKAQNVVARDPVLTLKPIDDVEIQDITYTYGKQQSEVSPERNGNVWVVELADLQSGAEPKVLVDLDVDPMMESLEETLLDVKLETDARRATDTVSVEIAMDDHPMLIESRADEEQLIIDVVDEATSGNTDGAKEIVEENSDTLSSEIEGEAIETLDAMEEGDRSAEEDMMYLLSKAEEDDTDDF